jgi:hypothetical protein
MTEDEKEVVREYEQIANYLLIFMKTHKLSIADLLVAMAIISNRKVN